MNKFFLTLAIALCAALTATAQNPVAVGQSQINAGLGFSSWGTPIFVGLDYGVHKDVTVGGELSYRSFGETSAFYDYSYTIIGIFANANYHFNSVFNIPRNLDLYAGASLGFYNWTLPSGYTGSYNSGLGLGFQIGGRYYFNNNIGVRLEFGGGSATGGTIGASFKL